jgi:uncharacterized protein (TIGR00299 family) protein
VRALILDPFAGISGDMLLGALMDLGLSDAWLRETVDDLGLGAGVTVERVDRSGIACTRVAFDLPDEHTHRHLPDVLEVIDRSGVDPAAKERAGAVFRRLAEAEGAVHGVDPDRVHFHEVGALDSILDVLCGSAAAHELGYERFYTRPVAVGSGTVEMAHGTYPLPAPATARLLAGMPVRETGWSMECTTPTGAAMLAELTRGTRPPEARYGRSGFGAGSRDPEGRPNCLRAMECTVEAGPASLYAVQADIDDLSAEYVAVARDALMEAGAVDVALVPLQMKKGRPGVRLEALTPEAVLDAVLATLFGATSTIGARYWRVERTALPRQEHEMQWRGQRIRWKRVTLPDGSTREKPELDDVVAAARELGMTPRDVRLEVDAERSRTAPDR